MSHTHPTSASSSNFQLIFDDALKAYENVRASQDALFEIFERVEAFLQRLEIYTEAARDQKMVDTVAKIVAEILIIVGIATKEIKQGQTKKYLKKLFGNRKDIEDALKRLDILTQQEAQMAAAQVLKATHTVDDTGRVRGVADIAAGVGDQVQSICDRVQGVNDKVTAAMDDVKKGRSSHARSSR